MVLLNIIIFSHSTILMWDTRPPPEKKKAMLAKPQKTFANPLSALDLTWKPFFKASQSTCIDNYSCRLHPGYQYKSVNFIS